MIRTLKIKYRTDSCSLSLIKDYMRQYSSLYHIVFNRTIEGYSQKEIKQYVKRMSNLNLLDSWFVQSSVFDVRPMASNYRDIERKRQEKISKICKKKDIDFSSLSKTEKRVFYKKYKVSKNSSVTFGSKNSFREYHKGNISKEELKSRRLIPIYSIGEVSNKSVKSNRKFQIAGDLSSIIFKPSRNVSVRLDFINLASNYKGILQILYSLQESKDLNISYRLDSEYVYVIIEETDIKEFMPLTPKIPNRVFAIDMNPNYIGWSVVDWKDSAETSYRLIKSGIFSIKRLNDFEDSLHVASDHLKKLKVSNRRKHEILEISKKLVSIAKYYRCQVFSVEDLSMKTGDKGLGKAFNRLVINQWNRNILISSLRRRCDLYSIKFVKVRPEYSSFLGNILYRGLNLPDMVLSSVEISRRGFEFYNQYISKKRPKKKNIVFPEGSNFTDALSKSMEELNIAKKFETFKKLYEYVKEYKIRYRFSLDQFSDLKFFRFSSRTNKFIMQVCI